MDPVTHTLVGASLAETGLKRLSRYAAATLVIGANLLDIDAITYFWSGDQGLLVRRGWTQGVLAMAVLPAMLGLVMWAAARRLSPVKGQPVRASALIALAYLSIWTHPALDWLNSYGVRLLMPFYRRDAGERRRDVLDEYRQHSERDAARDRPGHRGDGPGGGRHHRRGDPALDLHGHLRAQRPEAHLLDDG